MSDLDEMIEGLYERMGVRREAPASRRPARFRRLRLLWIRFRIWWIQRRIKRNVALMMRPR